MTGQEYWESRTQARLLQSEARGVRAIAEVLPIYQQIERNILRDIQSLYNNYAKNGVLTKDDLEKTLTKAEQSQFLKKVKEKAKALGIDVDKVYDERYLSRLNRLRALQEQVRVEIATIAPQEVSVTEQAYKDIANNNYETVQRDFKIAGVTSLFSTLDSSVLEEMLRNKWVDGKNYSSRVWGNTDELAKQLRVELGAALAGGVSYDKTARIIRDRFKVSTYVASRLIRTESNYFHNQTDLQSYVDNGVEEYRYDAVMDGHTSAFCDNRKINKKTGKPGLNGNIYKVSEAKVGVNFPPLHPHCRSTTSAVFETTSKQPISRYDRTKRFNVGPSNTEIQHEWARKKGEKTA